MFAGTLAMLHRALRVDARLWRTHVFRFSFAFLIYIGVWLTRQTSFSVGAPGLRLFEAMTWLNVALIVLAGISFFATAITEEKELETLGLLKLAGIDPLGILLGKSTSRLLGAILLLLVQFPFILLAITLGGVTIEQVIAAYCSLAAFLVLMANLGLFCSVAFRRGGTASIVTLVVLIVYFAAPYAIGTIKLGFINGAVIAPNGAIAKGFDRAALWCNDASLVTRLRETMRTGFIEQPIGFQVLVSLAGAAAVFAAAWLGFNYFTSDSKTERRPRADLHGRFIGLLRRRRSRPERRALVWKEYQFVVGGLPMQLAKLLIYGLIAAATLWASERYYNYPMSLAAQYVVVGMLTAIVLESSLYASVIFHDEWRDHTLPILAMLPVRAPAIISSKIVGCAPGLIPALIWLIVGCAVWPDGLEEAVKFVLLPSRWFFVLVWLLFLTLIAFFSLVVRWGALPLALLVMALAAVVTSLCGSPIILLLQLVNRQSGVAEGGFVFVDAVIGLLIFGLQFDLRRRLEIASSQ
ncbi:MAG TPA: ABC transporter permease [Planctomycetaceae bacterium]|nr:ABC transporter permease [Planctomycetaceae bacterium]